MDLSLLEDGLCQLPLLARSKIALFETLHAYKAEQPLALYKPEAFAYVAQLVVDVLGCRQRVQQIIQKSTDYGHLSEQLDQLLHERATGLSAELTLATQQCLMKDYSLQHESHIDIYSAWRSRLETGSVL
jgi:uncharacterized membrane protein YgaE (UPF0421/DUF939 family)